MIDKEARNGGGRKKTLWQGLRMGAGRIWSSAFGVVGMGSKVTLPTLVRGIAHRILYAYLG